MDSVFKKQLIVHITKLEKCINIYLWVQLYVEDNAVQIDMLLNVDNTKILESGAQRVHIVEVLLATGYLGGNNNRVFS